MEDRSLEFEIEKFKLLKKRSSTLVGRESESRNVPIGISDEWLSFCSKSLFVKICSSRVNYSRWESTERGIIDQVP